MQNYPWPRDSVIEDIEIYGTAQDAQDVCEADQDGVIDPISMDPIPPAQLVRIRTAGALRCYNLQTLIDINNDTGIDHFTRLPFARDLRDAIFELQLASRALQDTPETVRFREEDEEELEGFESLLNQYQQQYSLIVDAHRRILNTIRHEVRNAVLTKLGYPEEEFLQTMRQQQTIRYGVRERHK